MFDFKVSSIPQSTTKPPIPPQVSQRTSKIARPPIYETRKTQTDDAFQSRNKQHYQHTRRTDSCSPNSNSQLYISRTQPMNTFQNQSTSYYQRSNMQSHIPNQLMYNPQSNQSFYSHFEPQNSKEEDFHFET